MCLHCSEMCFSSQKTVNLNPEYLKFSVFMLLDHGPISQFRDIRIIEIAERLRLKELGSSFKTEDGNYFLLSTSEHTKCSCQLWFDQYFPEWLYYFIAECWSQFNVWLSHSVCVTAWEDGQHYVTISNKIFAQQEQNLQSLSNYTTRDN